MADYTVIQFWTVVSLLLCGVYGGPDNQGREYIIGYMENLGSSLRVELFVTTIKSTVVNVQITAPQYSSASINEQFTVTAGQVKQIFLSNTIRMTGSSKSTKGILVSADNEIIIYGVNKETYSCDAFLGIPTDVLGTEYYAVTYYPATIQTELLVVGITNATTVNITLGSALGNNYVQYNGENYYAGDTITDTMDRYDTLQLVSSGDLTGTYVQGDKKLSVFSGNKKTSISSGSSSDHLVEHLIPVSTWGKKFATVPIPARTTGDYFRFITSENNTQITISGGVSKTITLSSKGDFQQELFPSTAYCQVQSDKPIMIMQFCLSQQTSSEPSDPMMQIIYPIQQFAADYTFATPKYSLGSYNNYFMFIVKNSEKDGLRVDGNAFPGNTIYNSIPGTEYVGGYINVAEGSHTVRHTSPIALFGGYLYGQARFETYGFPTGMRLAPINTVCSPTTQETGDGFDNDCDGLIDEEICGNSLDDDGDSTIDEDCAKPPPIDGNWSEWGNYSACSITCKDFGTSQNGTMTRSRTCTNPAPQYDGKECDGSGTSSDTCTTSTYCPINGNWGAWSVWEECSKTCGTGSQSRNRRCDNPAPAHGGSCSGNSSQFQDCNNATCPSNTCAYGWFACKTGNTCIQNVLKCNCDSDCSDGSDETESHAGCSTATVTVCTSGTEGLIRTSVGMFLLSAFLAVKMFL